MIYDGGTGLVLLLRAILSMISGDFILWTWEWLLFICS